MLGHLRKINRGGVVAWSRSKKPLTAPNKMIVVVPDCHINLLRGDTIDWFQYRPIRGRRMIRQPGKYVTHEIPGDYKSDLQSLEDELVELTDVGKKYGARIAQVGDIYEVWEAEMVLRLQYLRMLQYALDCVKDELSHPMENVITSDKSWYRTEGFAKYVPNNAIRWMIESGKVVPINAHESMGAYIDRMKKATPASVQSKAIDFTSTDAICDAIEAKYPKLFKPGRFDIPLRGNHDNFLPNPYWSLPVVKEHFNIIATGGFDHALHDVFGYLTKTTAGSTKRNKLLEHLEAPGGESAQVWMEHGHYYDWHNNDSDWAGQSHGFDTVFRGVVPGVVHDVFRGGGYIDIKRSSWWLGETASSLGGTFPDRGDYEMRLPEVRRADALYGDPYTWDKERLNEELDPPDFDPLDGTERKKRPTLVIMGHTHGPCLLEIDRNLPLRHLKEVIRGLGGIGWRGYTRRGYQPEHDGQFMHEPCGINSNSSSKRTTETQRRSAATRVSPIGREAIAD
ncbi:hypothetical protein OT109_15595 [Phycisphaeraceae bacterium D3-23]